LLGVPKVTDILNRLPAGLSASGVLAAVARASNGLGGVESMAPERGIVIVAVDLQSINGVLVAIKNRLLVPAPHFPQIPAAGSSGSPAVRRHRFTAAPTSNSHCFRAPQAACLTH